MIRRTLAPATALLLAVGCRGGDIDRTDSTSGGQLPPPAAALSSGEGAVGLQDRLDRLEQELTAVLDGNLDEEAQASLMRAEAATDRLLEDEPESAWLGSGYFVEARLRQIQALADRVVAEFRRGVAPELVLEDVAALRLSVTDLRSRLQQGGNGAPPPPLDSLLAGYGDEDDALAPSSAASAGSGDTTSATAAVDEPAAAPEPRGLLGEPIRP